MAKNQRITIQKNTQTTTAMGGRTDVWTDLATVWADMRQLSGKEYYDAQALNTELTASFTIHYRDDITADMRVIYKTRTFELVSPPIDVMMRHKELRLMCREVNG
jgi:SPP1 family predicted phage head-tail adaptor